MLTVDASPKIKCDETKPACLNCVRRNITCPGYQQTLRWSNKHQPEGASSSANASTGTAQGPALTKSARPMTSRTETIYRAESLPAYRSILSFMDSPPDDGLCFDDSSDSSPFAPWALDGDSTAAMSSSPVSFVSATSSTSDGSESTDAQSNADELIPLHQSPHLHGSGTEALPPQSILSTTSTQPQRPLVDAMGFTLSTAASLQLGDATSPALRLPLEAPSSQRSSYASVPPPLLDPSTMLIEFWFHSVCMGWAAYDSPTNPFRQLCASLWSSSGAVYYSMQTMAAASIHQRHHKQHWPAHWPLQIQKVIVEAPQLSIQALIHDIDTVFQVGSTSQQSSANARISLPAGLLVSLFCMSSSLSWIDSRELGLHYLQQAQILLDHFGRQKHKLSAEDRGLLGFFQGCLVYEKMLRSIVSEDVADFFIDAKNSEATSGDGASITGTFESSTSSTNPAHSRLELHAWAGIPTLISWLFGKVMVLCRQSRALWLRSGRADFKLMHTAMAQIQEAQKLEEKLLSINVGTLLEDDREELDVRLSHAAPGNPGIASLSSSPSYRKHYGGTLDLGAATSDTTEGHQAENRQHLILASEAYRLCALLHLHQTFPDLVARRLPQQICLSDGVVPDDAWVQPLALHIVNILREIPASSGMRCLQPLLCISVGSALSQDTELPVPFANTPSFDPVLKTGGNSHLGAQLLPSSPTTTNSLCSEDRETGCGQLAPSIPLAAAYYWEGFLPLSTSHPQPHNAGSFDTRNPALRTSLPEYVVPATATHGTPVSRSSSTEIRPAIVEMGYASSIAHLAAAIQGPPYGSRHSAATSTSSPDDVTIRDTKLGKIQDSRAFLRQRIFDLQQVLPPKPVVVAGELLEEIWSTMDTYEARSTQQQHGCLDSDSSMYSGRAGGPHWLDLVGTGRFQSVFA